jgi:eukaryotic-like serine/threonine-protein kinase
MLRPMADENPPDPDLFACNTVLTGATVDDREAPSDRDTDVATRSASPAGRTPILSELPRVNVAPSKPETSLAVGTEAASDDTHALPSNARFEARPFARRYAPKKLLGQGGMGEVRLYHDEMIGRDVAMKTVRATDGEPRPSTQHRFAREAQIQAQLEHPSILPVYDVGVDPSGALYFTMKRVRGVSLAHVLAGLKEGDPELTARYTRRRLLTLFSNLCMAIDFCHAKGVVHRDLKPSNVMLGSFGEVYLLDWGLALVGSTPARRSAPMVDEEREPSKLENVKGTPGYMAPEQIENASSVDARADVYALGVILFELLTLERLHVARPIAETLVSSLDLDGARPASRAPERDVPPELDRLCTEATRRDPEARLRSAAELSRAIEDYLDGDRDLALRRELAASHASEARAALTRANDGHDEHEERARAMREATAALGLDVSNPIALGTLMRLIAEPPRTVPEEARLEIEASQREVQRIATRAALVFYLGYVLYLPLLLWMGIRDSSLFTLGWMCIGACVAATGWTLVRPPKHLDVPLVHLATGTFTVGAVSVLFGPFVLVPMLALGSGVIYLSTFGDRRGLVPLVSCLAVVVPAALDWLGLVPGSYLFEDGKWTILPSVFHISSASTQTFVTIAIVASIFPACAFVAKLRRAYTDAQTKLHVQAWHLRRMIPEDAPQDT